MEIQLESEKKESLARFHQPECFLDCFRCGNETSVKKCALEHILFHVFDSPNGVKTVTKFTQNTGFEMCFGTKQYNGLHKTVVLNRGVVFLRVLGPPPIQCLISQHLKLCFGLPGKSRQIGIVAP